MADFLIPFLSGALGGSVAWAALEFVQKPFRGFFDLKRQSVEVLTRYANVQARSKQVEDSIESERADQPLGANDEKRLQEAEAAMRECGTKFIAFARTEKLALPALHWLGYDPDEIGRCFIGLSNSIGEYGSHRHYYRTQLDKMLRLS